MTISVLPSKSMYFTHRTTGTYWRIRRSSLCELGLPVVGCQGREKTYFSFNVIFFIPENGILNSVEVFLGYVLFHYNFFPKINDSAGSGGSEGSTGSTGSGGSTVY